MVEKKKEEKKIKYGIWSEDMKRHGRCWRFEISWFDNAGQRHRKRGSGYPSKSECEVVVTEILRKARLEKMGLSLPEPEKKLPDTTVGLAVTAYYKSRLDNEATRRKSQNPNARKHRGQLEKINAWAAFVGENTPVKTIDDDALLRWVAHESERGLQPASISRSLSTIRACLNYSRRKFADLKSYEVPAKPIKRSAENMRTRILDESEILALSDALAAVSSQRDAYDIFRVALGTAGRMDELLGVRWEDITGNSLRLFSSKTDKDRWLNNVPAVIAILKQRKKDNCGSQTHVFACKDHWLRKILQRVSVACEIPWGQNTPGSWVFHDCRHTALTNLLAHNCDLATVSKEWADHASIAETSRYLHPTLRSRQLATEASNSIIALASRQNGVHIPSTSDPENPQSTHSTKPPKPKKGNKNGLSA